MNLPLGYLQGGETTDEKDGPLLSPLQIPVDLASPQAASLSPPSPPPLSGGLAREVVPASWAGRLRISEKRQGYLAHKKLLPGRQGSAFRRRNAAGRGGLEHAKGVADTAAGPLDRSPGGASVQGGHTCEGQCMSQRRRGNPPRLAPGGEGRTSLASFIRTAREQLR